MEPMKNIKIATIFVLMIITIAQVIASDYQAQFEAVVRDEDFKPKIQMVTIEDLVSNDAFEGKHFKIVKGTSNNPIQFNEEDSELLLKAATVYYHLTIARNYFVNTLDSDFVKSMDQLIIRLDIKNKFNSVGHFANVEQDPQYNNAVSVPAGDGYEPANVPAWGPEIWFRPKKRVHVSELNGGLGGSGQIDGIFKNFRQQINRTNFQRFLVETFRADTDLISALIRTAGSSILLELVYRFRDPINYVFSRKNYFLESALVPEIIYHEYAHIALSDHLSINVSTPVNEGMADYFAAKIASSSKIAANIKKYSVFAPKKGEDDLQYTPQNEKSVYANDDFTFGLLYQIAEELKENENVDNFIFKARKSFTAGDTIIEGMMRGLLSTCKDVCEDKFNSRLKILRVANDAGL